MIRHLPGAAALLTLTLAGAAGLSACSMGGPPAFDPTAQLCHDMTFPVYFDRGSDQLTQDARTVIAATGARVKACRVNSAEVVGIAASIEPKDAAIADLPRRRADNVARALADAGLPAPKTDVAETAAHVGPARRRTEVILHLSPL